MTSNKIPEKPEPAVSAERARQWRRKADELLGIAEDVTLEETKLTILSLAHSYERLAAVMERTVPGECSAMQLAKGKSGHPETK